MTGITRDASGNFSVTTRDVDLASTLLIDAGPNSPTLGILTKSYSDNGVGTFTYTRHGYVKNNGTGVINVNFAITANVKTVNETMLAQLAMIEAMLHDMTDAAATIGAIRASIDSQDQIIHQFADTQKKALGRLVDADMNEASAKTRALQTREQLANQSLSIANAAPSTLLQLFR